MAYPLRRLRLSFPPAQPVAAMNASVVGIVSAFFIIGITVGAIVVIALSALRAGRPDDPDDPRGSGRGPQPPDARWHDGRPDEYPRWPGDVDNDFSC